MWKCRNILLQYVITCFGPMDTERYDGLGVRMIVNVLVVFSNGRHALFVNGVVRRG